MPTWPATRDDLPAIAEIYVHYVATSVATFELDPPDADERVRRFASIADAGDPASVQLHRRFGFTDAGCLTRVGYKHDRFVDTVLMQRTLA